MVKILLGVAKCPKETKFSVSVNRNGDIYLIAKRKDGKPLSYNHNESSLTFWGIENKCIICKQTDRHPNECAMVSDNQVDVICKSCMRRQNELP